MLKPAPRPKPIEPSVMLPEAPKFPPDVRAEEETRRQAERIPVALSASGMRGVALLGPDDVVRASVTVGPMLLAKGLEFLWGDCRGRE